MLYVLVAPAAVSACSSGGSATAEALLDLDAPALAAEIAAGRVSAERVTAAALARIDALDDRGPGLNAVIDVNPDALAIARELDRRFAAQGPVGPLHGVPVAVKANIDTADRMATSAGSIALAGHFAAADADIVARLREAGAVIIAKTNLSEWANFRSTRATSGWSSLGGQTRNAYVLDRNPCGSSSGSAVAVAARLVPLAVGTETDGSIVCPAAANGVVGLKPTHGRVSTRGIVPIAASQDTAGPLARTVAGAALLLAVLETPAAPDGVVAPGAGVVAPGAGIGAAAARSARSADGLRGVRLGVVRDYAGAGSEAAVEVRFAEWLGLLEQAGAELVDPIELALPAGVGTAELEVLLHEFRDGIDAYLAGVRSGPSSLEALIEHNERHAPDVMPHFGQELFVMAQARGGLSSPRYREAVAASQGVMRSRLDTLFAEHDLDALVAPANAPAARIDWGSGDVFSVSSSRIAALSGRPGIIVPGAMIGELPVAIAFVGAHDGEARLIEIAAVFERLRGAMPAPKFLPRTER